MMNKQPRGRLASLAIAAVGALFLGACGGGSDDTAELGTASESASGPAVTALATDDTAEWAASSGESGRPTVTALASYAVDATEIVRNGVFTEGLTGWDVGDAALVNSELRTGGKALNVGWHATQRLGSVSLSPRKSYTLKVKARNTGTTGSTEIAVRFRMPAYSENFRTYKIQIASNVYKDYKIEFTAPEYVGMTDVVFTASGTRSIIDSVSLRMRSELPQTERITSTTGSFVPAGYVLAFNDEFNGRSLNRNKWATRYIYGAETSDNLNDEKQRYRDNNNHIVEGGVLKLTARKVSSSDPSGVNYESGMVRSLWTSRYGYYEARVKMPGGIGVWPAFWLNSDVSAQGRLGWPPEIDIFEFVNNGVEDKTNMLHSGVILTDGKTSPLQYQDPAFNSEWTFYRAPFNFNEAWHTIGAEWDATSVTLFVDGKKIYTRSYTWTYGDDTLAGPAHILLNLAIGGSWAGRHGIDDSAFPQALQVDWVRAYKRAN